jgi:hypothetical protein
MHSAVMNGRTKHRLGISDIGSGTSGAFRAAADCRSPIAGPN